LGSPSPFPKGTPLEQERGTGGEVKQFIKTHPVFTCGESTPLKRGIKSVENYLIKKSKEEI